MSQLIKIKVKANSKKNDVVDLGGYYKVFVKKPAEDNKANIEIVKIFKKKFVEDVRIVKGLKSKEKVLKIG